MHQVFDAMAARAKRRPDAIAFRDDRDMLSWSGLAGRVYGLATQLRSAPLVIGIDLPDGVDYVIADLAATLAGRRVVPLPTFFGDEQRQHILRDAGIGAVIGLSEVGSGDISRIDPKTEQGLPVAYAGGADRVIYTSGSSGTPKGVIVGDRQLSASIAGLMDAVHPTEADRHLSVLPFVQLLEQIAGIFLPIVAGAETVIAPKATVALFGGPASAVAEAFDKARPTTSLLVPKLLNAWVADLKAKERGAASGLRFVAIGGASTSPHLIEEAIASGIPAYEGYGLSECCAVVSLNRPGDNAPGAAGRPLNGIEISIDDGEILVSGPTVMDGYLGGAPIAPNAVWRTGDVGRIDDGRLVVEGRKDALIVLPTGRNISPEWIEQRLLTLQVIASAALTLVDDRLIVVTAPRSPMGTEALAPVIEAALFDIPAYARPEGLIAVDPGSSGLNRPAGTPDRAVARAIAAKGPVTPLFTPQARKAS